MKKAYSYIRFSRSHQAQGDSLERQEAAAVKYCAEHGFQLDRSTYHDLGVSAFHSKNRKAGALGRFLEACKAGRISPGSALIIESLDRLSRDTPWESIGLLKALLDYGIETHVMFDRLVVRPEDSGGTDLMLITMLASRAHEESKTKSRRLLSAFAKKRESGGIVAPTLPWWLAFDTGKTPRIVSPPERKKIVVRIFKETAAGHSSQKIANGLNRDKIPTWRKKQTRWVASRVRELVRSKSPQGWLVATTKTQAAGRGYEKEGYYPRLVSDELAEEARTTLARNNSRGKAAMGRPPTGKRPINLLRGLLRHRGCWMRHMPHQNGKGGGYNSYYECIDPLTAKVVFSVPGNQLDPILLVGVQELSAVNLAPMKPTTPKRVALQKIAAALNEKITNIVGAIESGSKALVKRLAELESELARVETEIENTPEIVPPDTLGLKKLQAFPLEALRDPEQRSLIAAELNRLIERVDVDWDEHGLVVPKNFWAKAWGPASFLSDPTPNLRRKKIVLIITFRAGGQRYINRIPGERLESYRLPDYGNMNYGGFREWAKERGWDLDAVEDIPLDEWIDRNHPSWKHT